MQAYKDVAKFGSPMAAPDRMGLGVDLPGFTMTFSRNEEIFGEQEPADFVYRMVEGVARSMRVLSDGRRQIDAFHLPGDVFGLEIGAVHRFTAEAVSACKVALARRPALDRAVAQDAAAARMLWALTSHDLCEAQAHLLLLTRRSASERVCAFLLDMLDRTGGGHTVELPMSRLDIADYLGLTIETVSRTMTQLERDSLIALPSCRRVVVRDRAALAAFEA
jgi:CRP/FNR family transcriptional regulator, nitrogen fixation regulation protein